MEDSDFAFPGYVIRSNRAGLPFYSFVLIYTAFAFLLIAPLVSLSRKYEKRNLDQEDPENNNNNNINVNNNVTTEDQERQPQPGNELQKPQQPTTQQKTPQDSNSNSKEGPLTSRWNGPKKAASSVTTSKKAPSVVSGTRSGFSILLRELDRVAAAEYQNVPRGVGSRTATDHSSGIPSAATTSRLHTTHSSKRSPALMLDVSGRRWKHRRPIGRVDVIQRAIHNETGSLVLRSTAAAGKKRAAKGMSDVASSMLEEQAQDVETVLFNRAAMTYRNRWPRSRTGSFSIRSERSAMSSIVDDITPGDAADANDPGRGNIFVHPDNQNATINTQPGLDNKLGCISSFLEGLLQLVMPGEEFKRVLFSSVPLSIGAMSESLFRLITAAFISFYLGPESMISYLLVGLFVRLTSEQLAGAVVDALSSFLQECMFSGEANAMFIAGQYTQLAILLQLLLGVPLLIMWYSIMYPVVFWLCDSHAIAAIAEDYARVVVFNFLLQAVAQTCTVVYHMCGHEHFESFIDFSTSTVQLIVVASVLALVEDASLTTVGYIQVMIGVAAAVTKLMFPAMRGWTKPFRKGMIGSFALKEHRGTFGQLSCATFPLLVGSLLEYGEWEVLTLCLRYLGSAEVATWALLGAFWDVLEAFTEGIGEAASIQVAFLLASSQPHRARKISHSAIYLAIVQSILITSGLFMSGRYLAVLFSSDPTMQHLTNEAMSLIGLANISMSCSQISWSLIGAQGRFRLATSVVFFSRWIVTMPMALVCIFLFFLDLNSVAGCLVVGYSTASCALTFIVLRSDWDLLSKLMQEINCPPGLEGSDFFDVGDDDDDDDDESSSEEKDSSDDSNESSF